MISIKEYLDMEFGSIDLSYKEVKKRLEQKFPGFHERFSSLVEEVHSAWSNPYLSHEEVEKIEAGVYNFTYSDLFIDRLIFAPTRNREEATLEYLSSCLDFSNKRVLDLGSGSGIKTTYLGFFPGVDLVAVDRLESALRLLKQRYTTYGLGNIKGIQANLRDFDLGESFDIVLALQMLHESGDTRMIVGSYLGIKQKIDNLYRHLSPGGSFVATLNQINGFNTIEMVKDCAEANGLREISVDAILQEDENSLIALRGSRPK